MSPIYCLLIVFAAGNFIPNALSMTLTKYSEFYDAFNRQHGSEHTTRGAHMRNVHPLELTIDSGSIRGEYLV